MRSGENEIPKGNCACVNVYFCVGGPEVALIGGWSCMTEKGRKKAEGQYGARQR